MTNRKSFVKRVNIASKLGGPRGYVFCADGGWDCTIAVSFDHCSTFDPNLYAAVTKGIAKSGLHCPVFRSFPTIIEYVSWTRVIHIVQNNGTYHG